MNFKRILSLSLAVLMVLCLAGCTAMPAAGASGDQQQGGGIMVFVYFAVIIAVFYFLMIRPENKRKKKAAELRNNVAVGDEITTIGGMTGEVVSVDGDFITFETGEDRVRIEVAKWAISTKGRAANQ